MTKNVVELMAPGGLNAEMGEFAVGFSLSGQPEVLWVAYEKLEALKELIGEVQEALPGMRDEALRDKCKDLSTEELVRALELRARAELDSKEEI